MANLGFQFHADLAQLRVNRLSGSARWLSAVALMMMALLAPALWNGFPIIFADTGGYLQRPFEETLALGRSALYGAFLVAGMAFDFWPNIAIQAALASWIICLTLRCHGLGGRPFFAAMLIVGLCITTALPWYAAQLMPDILMPLAVLSLHLLLFQERALHRGETAALVILIAFAMASHMVVTALCAALLLAYLLYAMIPARARLPRVKLRAAAASLACGIALSIASNFAIADRAALTPGGVSFLFGRLIQDGIVARYLDDHCPDPSIRLCAYRHRLPTTTDDWLWSTTTPFWKLGGVKGYEEEEKRIILETLSLYPLHHIASAARTTLAQLLMVRTTASFKAPDNAYTMNAIAELAPGMMPRLRAARQQQPGEFDPSVWNVIHVPVAFAGMAFLPVILAMAAAGRASPRVATLSLTILLALLANAAICGIFSNPVDRYQSRLIWLAPFAVVIALARSRPDDFRLMR